MAPDSRHGYASCYESVLEADLGVPLCGTRSTVSPEARDE